MKLSEEEEKKIQEAAKPASPLRTFSSDLANAVQHDEMSVIKVAMAEQKRRLATDEAVSPTSTKNIRYIVGSLIVLIIAVGAVYGVYKYKTNVPPQVNVVETKINALIPADATTSIEIGGETNDKVIQYIQSAIKNVTAREGGIVNIYFTNSQSGVKQAVKTEEFFSVIESQIPPPLLRALEPSFMLGIVATTNDKKHPFLILKTNSYEAAFANMFTWETKLYHDFYIPLFLFGNQKTFEKRFGDLLIENKDTRVLYSDTNEVILLYSFIDEHTIVITTDIETFKTVRSLIETVRPQ